LHEYNGRAVATFALAADGKRLAFASREGAVFLGDPGTAKELSRLGEHRSDVVGLHFTPDGKTLISAAVKDNVLLLWDLDSKKARRFATPPAELTATALSRDGTTLALGNEQGAITLWDLAAARERGPTLGHQGHVHFLTFAPDGRRVTSVGGDGASCLWE